MFFVERVGEVLQHALAQLPQGFGFVGRGGKVQLAFNAVGFGVKRGFKFQAIYAQLLVAQLGFELLVCQIAQQRYLRGGFRLPRLLGVGINGNIAAIHVVCRKPF